MEVDQYHNSLTNNPQTHIKFKNEQACVQILIPALLINWFNWELPTTTSLSQFAIEAASLQKLRNECLAQVYVDKGDLVDVIHFTLPHSPLLSEIIF